MLPALLATLLLAAAPGHGQERFPTAPIVDGVAPVSPRNVTPIDPPGSFWVGLVPEPARATRPLVGPGEKGAAAAALRRLAATGRAVGLAGVLYDNRDRRHSRLPPDRFPQLSHTSYAEVLRNEGLDYGLTGRFLFSLPTIGNSSTAFTRGKLARSLPRSIMTDRNLAQFAFLRYAANHIYVYPEHRDHDAERGDRFPANTPFQFISQGSSHSDRPFVTAAAEIIAAFRPQTRAYLETQGLLAPSVQMVFRRSLVGVNGTKEYLSGRAHPVVFRADAIRPAMMVALANALTPDTVPPMVRLNVEQDFSAVPGRDYLAENLDEVLFDTPASVARVWRSYAWRRTIVLSAGDTRDPNGLPLEFHWVLLRGNPEKVRIRHPEGDRSRAEIQIDWHHEGPFGTPGGLPGPRIDIGVFADNGTWISAPGFLSVTFPRHQRRVYEMRNGAMRLQVIGYAVADGDYADPMIWPVSGWTDRLTWDADGRLEKLDRRHAGGRREHFDAVPGGLDAAGDASEDVVWHRAEPGRDGSLRMVARTGTGAQISRH